MLKAELSLPLLHKTAAASCCCSGHCRPWLNLLLLNNKTIPFPSLTRPDRSSHKWVPWRSSHSVCGVRGCCWNKSASFCIRIFGIHCLHLHLHITATQNSDAEMRRRCLSERASKQASKRPPPKKPIERNVPTRAENERQTYQKQAVCSLSEIDGFKQLVKKRNSPSLSLCVALWRKLKLKLKLKLSHSHQSQPWKKLTVLSSSSSSMRTHSLQNRTVLNYESLRHHSFIHSLLDFLGALLLSNSPQNVRPKVRRDEEEEEEKNLTRTRISTHNAQEEEIMVVVRIIKQEEINQSD